MILITTYFLFHHVSGQMPQMNAAGSGADAAAGFSCVNPLGYTDPYLGSVKLDPSVCLQNPNEVGTMCLRSMLCCQPQKPEDVIQTFRFFDASNQETQILWSDASKKNVVNACSKVVYIIHGYGEVWESSSYTQEIKDGWIKKGSCVIGVDWKLGSTNQLLQSAANAETVGRAVAYSIKIWGIGSKSLLVGHCVGAQIVGAAGKFYKKITGQLLKDCHALEPMGPAFDGCGSSVQIQPTDCEAVQVMHTGSQRMKGATGASGCSTFKKSGRCDYWVNCGYMGDQEPCPQVNPATFAAAMTSPTGMAKVVGAQACDHMRAPLMYASFLAGKCRFDGATCPSCRDPLMGHSIGIDRCTAGLGPADQKFMIENACNSEADYYIRIPPEKGQNPFC